MANDEVQRPELRLLQAWTTAEQQTSKPGSLRVVPLNSVGRQVHVSVAQEGWRGLVIPLDDGEIVSVPKEFRSNSRGALRAELAQFSVGAEATDALHTWCRDRLGVHPSLNPRENTCVMLFSSQPSTGRSDRGILLSTKHYWVSIWSPGSWSRISPTNRRGKRITNVPTQLYPAPDDGDVDTPSLAR